MAKIDVKAMNKGDHLVDLVESEYSSIVIENIPYIQLSWPNGIAPNYTYTYEHLQAILDANESRYEHRSNLQATLSKAGVEAIFVPEKKHICTHPKKYINRATRQAFIVCPDCRADLGDYNG